MKKLIPFLLLGAAFALDNPSVSNYAHSPGGTTGDTTGLGASFLKRANNLSDVSSVATSISNLGLGPLNSPTFAGLSTTSPAITTSITTPSTTFALLNTTATTVNAFGAATTVNTGAAATQIWNFGGSTTASQFRFLEPSGSGTNYSAFKAVAQAADITYSLPPTVGAAGTFLTDVAGNGVLTWAAAGAPANTIANGLTSATTAGAAFDSLTVSGGNIASATTTNLCTAAGIIDTITGTTTITGFGTCRSGAIRHVIFTGALTLTYNATSLTLPGSANITTVAGDAAIFQSNGNGNWVCVSYSPRTVTGTGSAVKANAPALTGTATGVALSLVPTATNGLSLSSSFNGRQAIHVENTSNTAGATAQIDAVVNSNSAGDAYYTAALLLGSQVGWAWGLDNSVTGDPFVLSYAVGTPVLGTNNALSITGTLDATFGASLTTAAPSGGTAGAWKLGIYKTDGVALAPSTTNYIQVDIGGTLYKLVTAP